MITKASTLIVNSVNAAIDSLRKMNANNVLPLALSLLLDEFPGRLFPRFCFERRTNRPRTAVFRLLDGSGGDRRANLEHGAFREK